MEMERKREGQSRNSQRHKWAAALKPLKETVMYPGFKKDSGKGEDAMRTCSNGGYFRNAR